MTDTNAPTAEQIGSRIAEAIDNAPEELLAGKPPMKRRRVTVALGLSDDTLDRYIKGEGNPSALTVWKIGQMTGMPFAWFAGQTATPEERLAVIAERASEQVAEVTSLLNSLRSILTEVVGQVRLDDPQLDGAPGVGIRQQAAQEVGKTVTVPREATS